MKLRQAESRLEASEKENAALRRELMALDTSGTALQRAVAAAPSGDKSAAASMRELMELQGAQQRLIEQQEAQAERLESLLAGGELGSRLQLAAGGTKPLLPNAGETASDSEQLDTPLVSLMAGDLIYLRQEGVS
jgi:predicted RNase H-like nuclease (RuvC/YqgF family)